jgi:endonuclease-3 related protein
MVHRQLMEIYNLLYERYGPQHWWPGEGTFEIIVGAILTQNTNWQNVEKALANLKQADALTPQRLYEMEVSQLAAMIRPAGYFNIKAKRLKNFLGWMFDQYQGRPEAIGNANVYSLRQELLSINGIGPETADSILLYALDMPVFVVDTYSCRVLVRHGLIEAGADYEQLQQLFEANLAQDVKLFNEYHALLVRLGKEHCRPKPNCKDCPLESLAHQTAQEVF